MDAQVSTSFDARELEVIYASLDNYITYLQNYVDKFPVLVKEKYSAHSSSKGDLEWCIEVVSVLKSRVEEIVSLNKAANAVH